MLTALLLCTAITLYAQPSIGGYSVYYGHLHNHCNISDGVLTPAQAYQYAKETGGLDFFSLSDHSGSITAGEWTAMKAAADLYNTPGFFTAFWGFEWTENVLGHVTVINPTNYITTASPYNTFQGLCTWLNSNECVAFFNHPGRNNSTGLEFDHFATTPTDKIVGIELWNKTDRFETYYYTDGYYSGDGNMSWYDEALFRGWNVGASGSEDNHSGTWGTMAQSKLAVLAPANTREDIMAALKARRFFTTYDRNMALSFTIGGSQMGSTITGATYDLQISATDADNETFTVVQLLKNGQVISTWNPASSTPVISGSLTCFGGEYYYIRVKQADGDEAVSSPIRVSGGLSNSLPTVAINAPVSGTVYTAPATFTIAASANDTDGTIAKVEFYQGSALVGEDAVSPFSLTLAGLVKGDYSFTAKAIDNLGGSTMSAAVSVTVINTGDPVVRSAIIASGPDDVEENAAGTIYNNSTDIELVYDSYNSAGNQVVGLRFAGLLVPRNAIITNAYIQFTCDEVNTAACNLTIAGQAADNAPAFTTTAKDVSNRARTAATVSWIPAGWPTADVAGADQRTPNISSIIQEIVNRPGYSEASAMAIIITGTGSRIAEAYEGAPASAARLFVEYAITPVNQPPVISLTAPASGTSYTEPANITITASASDPDGTISQVEFYQGTTLLSTDLASPWEFTLTNALAGSYSFTAKATDNSGATAVSAAVSVTVTAPVTAFTFSSRIATGTDDAEEYANGTMTLSSSALEMAYASRTTGNQLVGLRFAGVTIPKGATITRAYIQFGASAVGSASCSLTVRGESAASSATYKTTKKNISGRLKTAASVAWSPATWTPAGAVTAAQQTPDLKALVQEILGNAGWASGNSMGFIISGTGTRSAYAFEGSAAKAALLYVEYTYSGKSGMLAGGEETGPAAGSAPLTGELHVYPVPFSDRLFINLTVADGESVQSVRLINANGIAVREMTIRTSNCEIDVADLPSGIYILQYRTNLTNYRKTVLKI